MMTKLMLEAPGPNGPFFAPQKLHPITDTLQLLPPNSCNILLKVVVAQEAPVIVDFQPVVEVNLVQIRGYKFFAQFVSFRT